MATPVVATPVETVTQTIDATTAKITAAVLREALASGDMQGAISLFGAQLSTDQKSALGQISALDLVAIRAMGQTFSNVGLGDKLA